MMMLLISVSILIRLSLLVNVTVILLSSYKNFIRNIFKHTGWFIVMIY